MAPVLFLGVGDFSRDKRGFGTPPPQKWPRPKMTNFPPFLPAEEFVDATA